MFLSGRRLVFDSPLTPDQATERLRQQVTPPAWKLVEDRPQLFEGTFENGRFQMVRLVRGRNSFRPVIEGTLQPGNRGTRIDVRMKLHPLVVVFCGVFLAFGAMVAAVAIPEWLAASTTPAPVWLFLGLAAAVAAAFLAAPGIEARTATRMLQDLFEAEPSAGR